jgi:hypothetical protein
MGGILSTKTKYLSKDEIEKISSKNATLERLFERYKNYEGYIGFREFTYLVGNKVEPVIKKKLFKLFTIYNNNTKFSLEVLKNFYAIFYNYINSNAKSIFLAELIFANKDSKRLSKYVERVVLMFKKADNLQNLLLNKQFYSKFQSKENSLLLKEGFIALLNTSVYSNFLRQFNFINYSDPNKKYIKHVCNCFENKLTVQNNKNQNSNNVNGIMTEREKKRDSLSLMEDEYRRQESKNGGLFTIQMFERMLNDIDCDKRLSSYLINYIKRKIEKVKLKFIKRNS